MENRKSERNESDCLNLGSTLEQTDHVDSERDIPLLDVMNSQLSKDTPTIEEETETSASSVAQTAVANSSASVARSRSKFPLSGTRTKRPRGATASKDEGDKWAKLQNLKNLLSAGFISKTEYADRKAQLIDDLTGTTCSNTTVSSKSRTRHNSSTVTSSSLPIVLPRPPPDFKDIKAERAIKYVFDIEKQKWNHEYVELKLDPTPFSRGALRYVYHMQEIAGNKKNAIDQKSDDEEVSKAATYVAKISIDKRDQTSREVYFRDVEMQCLAKFYAVKFNEYNPPKKVDFVKAWIFELTDREGRPIVGVERFIDGPYRKHNNNYGYVNDEERSTPQAFSHFTWEVSGHYLLIVDIQGVGDLYTDPQVHSFDGNGFGKGNMGKRGIDKFLQTHRCNAICQYLKLPAINANYSNFGTLPVTRFMSYNHIAVVDVSHHMTPETPLLPPVVEKPNNKSTSNDCCCTIT